MNWILLSIIAMLLWGVWSIFIRFAFSHFSWQQLLPVAGLAEFLVFVFTYIWFKPSVDLHSKGFYHSLLAGAINGIALIAFWVALSQGKTSVVYPLVSISPIVTVILSYVIFHERITHTQGLGILFALIAILLLSIE